MLKREKDTLVSGACSIPPFEKPVKVETSFASNFVCKLGCNLFDFQSLKQNTVESDLKLEDLPDGSCFNRVLPVDTLSQRSGHANKSTVRKCEYIGSFLVTGNDHISRAEYVRAQLDQMKETVRRRPVLLLISLTGIKVYSPDGKSVLMAHALKRISFATCDPGSNHFSFLAREPNDYLNQQYCHSFFAVNAKEVEELNRLVGATFRMAYAQQLAQPLSVVSSMPTPPTSGAHIHRGIRSSSTALPLDSPVLRRSTCRSNIHSPSHPAAKICWIYVQMQMEGVHHLASVLNI